MDSARRRLVLGLLCQAAAGDATLTAPWARLVSLTVRLGRPYQVTPGEVGQVGRLTVRDAITDVNPPRTAASNGDDL